MQEDELPPPIFSAPPASIPQVASQLDSVAQASESPAPILAGDAQKVLPEVQMDAIATSTNPDEGQGPFQFGFSQVAGIMQSTSEEIVETEVQEPSDSSEQFGLHYSQLIDADAMTQI